MKRSLALALFAVVALSGCAQSVALQPAANATDKACASVIVDISRNGPKTLGDGLDIRETNAQGTAAWGNPTSVILRCGVEEPLPTATLVCDSIDGVDWLVDDSKAPSYVATTYGRSPAIEVIIDSEAVTPALPLTELSGSVGLTKKSRECTKVNNTL